METLAGQPLRPWTIPNAIGFVRLALIPVFLVVSYSSSTGTGGAIAGLFAVIGWGDYADGIAARLTGQYSRLGALMDPVTDRLLVISGAAVCWSFELLPRWALAVLAVRELAMLGLGRYGQTHGLQLTINWPGRIGVGVLMGALFFAMAGLETVGEVMLYTGLLLALTATVLYAQAGYRQLASPSSDPASSSRILRPPNRIHPQAQLYGKVGRVSVTAGVNRAREREAATGDRLGMDTFPDLGSLDETELKDLIKRLTDEETEISYQRRILHGKIDILRAELVNRLRKKHDGGAAR